MLSVQSSETWALSQANPKTKPISPKPNQFFPKPNLFVPKTEPVFPKKGTCFFPKSVTHFPKIGNGFPRNRRWISSKSVTHFPKSVTHFPKSVTHFPKSVTHFPKVGDGFPQNRWLISWEPSLVSRNPNSQSQKIPNAFLSMYILAQNTKTMRDFQPATTRGACRKTQTRVNLWISCVSTLKCICKHGMLPCASGFDV